MKMDNSQEAQNGHTVSKLPEKSKEKTAQRISNPVRPRLLSLKKAAEYLGVSEWGMRTIIWNGDIPSVRYPGGRKFYIDVKDLDAFVEANKTTYN
jgi:excisionase family DNA binding protein